MTNSEAVNIRSVHSEEAYPAVMRLLRQLQPNDPIVPDQTGRELFRDILKSDALHLLVAEIDGVICGTCYLNIIPNLTRSLAPYALIENVVTDAAQRRKGIGKQLLEAAIEKAFALGCYKVMLMTGRGEQTQHFYESCGMTRGAKTAFIIRA
ncbi:MAG: GNAT family N-acetyltransferase [Candidatus Promineifilaceae bacterium]